ncbi:small-subunit processome [Xylariomycetidae sp. FL0641]|nr:small-subunit processome [Xylariomycetidae sp. FL0641]
MPGRQAHGRSLLGNGGSGKGKGNKGKRSGVARSQKKALDAFAIAQNEYGDRMKQTPRNRELDAQVSHGRGKHARQDDDDEEEEDDDDDEGPPRKMRRADDAQDDDIEYGSDSSGNEWRVGVAGDDDSDIDSDEAFGDSDEERFEDYAFRGSQAKGKGKNKSKKGQDDEDDDSGSEDDEVADADGASLGSDAIDLADALDMSMSDDDGPAEANDEEDLDDDDSDAESAESAESASGDDSSDVEDDDDDEDDDVSDTNINAWVSQFSGVKNAEQGDEPSTTAKPKLSLKDLGLLGTKDPELKKSLKLMNKEERSSKPQKLDVPLAKREQARIDRHAAQEKTNESLGRWLETVKQNRRADHVVFQNDEGAARHDNSEIMPLNQKAAGTELEQTILAIMEESGLGPAEKKERKHEASDDEVEGLSRADRKTLWQEKRRERELKSREDARAKRIKKIKSKAYHRVHRKQKERDEIKAHEAAVEAGEVDSEDEREAQDRQRAMERMGARHRESKWAKMKNKDGRAAWDDNVRTGVIEMARRDDELRRRIEGKSSGAGDDDDGDSEVPGDPDDIDERRLLLQQLNEAPDDHDDDSQPKSKLMKMAFMQRSEAAKKKANDDMVAQIRRDLASDDEGQDESDEPDDVGRRKYGQPASKMAAKSTDPSSKAGKNVKSAADGLQEARDNFAKASNKNKVLSLSEPQGQSGDGMAGSWSQPSMAGPPRKLKGKGTSDAAILELDTNTMPLASSRVPAKSSKVNGTANVTTNGTANGTGAAEYSSDDEDGHMPIRFRDQELLEKAFAGQDVVAQFEDEKAAAVDEDDEKVVDNTLPGWGSWVGEGVSNKEKKRHQGRFLTKKEGVKKNDRRDAKLQNVIINEKRVKKNDKYLASQLPHVFETRAQYERSLRLPVGPEWQTKETFQEATKPRVIVKQGIIAPLSKPTR